MRSDLDIEAAIDAHGDTVWRTCRARLGGHDDAQDAFQETFLKYALHEEVVFNDDEHKKAWLIRVATNLCLDMLRSASHKTDELDDQYEQVPTVEPSDHPDSALWEVTSALDRLPPDQRQAVYLTVCEGIPAVEVAQIMGVPVNTVYSWAARGKQTLREVLA